MQGELLFTKTSQDVSGQEILRQCENIEQAIDMSLNVAGVNRKSLAFHLNMSEASLSRKLRKDPNDPQYFAATWLIPVMELTRNIIPARFLCLKLNHDAAPLKSWERLQIEERDARIAELERKLTYFEEFLSKVKV